MERERNSVKNFEPRAKAFFSGNNWKRWLLSSLVGVGLYGATLAVATPAFLRIQMDGFSPYYFPNAVDVSVGTIIWWENPTATHHTITHDGCKNGGFCAFDSGTIAPKGKFSLYSLAPGRYPYHCTLHPIMRGVVVVRDGGLLQET